MSKKKLKKENMKPNPIIWFVYTLGSKIVMSFKNKIIKGQNDFKKRNKKEGSLLIFNHNSNKDHFVSTIGLNYVRSAYVTSTHFFFKKKLRIVLKLARTIPKEQFKSDISTIKKIKRAVEQRIPVMIAPTGQITIHGEQLSIDRGIVKLIRMNKVDVYAFKIHGTYYAYPKWAKFRRKVPLYTDFIKILDKNDLPNLTDDQIYKTVCDSINVNDRLEQHIYNYKLKKEHLVEGLEDILYYCPKCNTKYEMIAKDDELKCNHCNNTIRMNEKGFLEGIGNGYRMFQNEAEWYKWEQRKLLQEINSGTFKLEEKFHLFHNATKKYELDDMGIVKLILTKDRLFYEQEKDGNILVKEFKLERVTQLPFEVRHHFDIPDDDGKFEFRLLEGDRGSKVTEFVQAIEVLALSRQNKEII